MVLEDAVMAFEHKIVSGSEYCWNCFGPNARYLDFESEYASGSVIYDTKTFQVYEATINDKADRYRYRWIEPSMVDSFKQECDTRGIDFQNAWDNLDWYDLEVEDDFLEKSHAIFIGKEFDTRVSVPLDLTDEEILHLSLEAHKRDITLNKFVEILIIEAVNKYKLSTE